MTKIVENFVKNINPNITIKWDSEEFCADTDELTVCVGQVYHNYEEQLFLDFVEKEFGIIMDIFLVSLLHEIGHIETFDEEIDEERTLFYSILMASYEEDKIEEYNEKYFRIKSEYNATEWAVNYYLDNKELCDEFISQIMY